MINKIIKYFVAKHLYEFKHRNNHFDQSTHLCTLEVIEHLSTEEAFANFRVIQQCLPCVSKAIFALH